MQLLCSLRCTVATTELHAMYSLHTLYILATTELCSYDNLMYHAGHYEKGLRTVLKLVRDALQEDCDDEEDVADDLID